MEKLLLIVDAPVEVSIKTWPTDPPPNSYDAPNPCTIRTGFEISIPAKSKIAFTVSLVPQKAINKVNKKIPALQLWKHDQ